MYSLQVIIIKWQTISAVIILQIQKLLQIGWVTKRPLFLMASSIMYNECLTLCIVWYILMSDVAETLETLQSLLKYE